MHDLARDVYQKILSDCGGRLREKKKKKKKKKKRRLRIELALGPLPRELAS